MQIISIVLEEKSEVRYEVEVCAPNFRHEPHNPGHHLQKVASNKFVLAESVEVPAWLQVYPQPTKDPIQKARCSEEKGGAS